jgi:hypothetical protein
MEPWMSLQGRQVIPFQKKLLQAMDPQIAAVAVRQVVHLKLFQMYPGWQRQTVLPGEVEM